MAGFPAHLGLFPVSYAVKMNNLYLRENAIRSSFFASKQEIVLKKLLVFNLWFENDHFKWGF